MCRTFMRGNKSKAGHHLVSRDDRILILRQQQCTRVILKSPGIGELRNPYVHSLCFFNIDNSMRWICIRRRMVWFSDKVIDPSNLFSPSIRHPPTIQPLSQFCSTIISADFNLRDTQIHSMLLTATDMSWCAPLNINKTKLINTGWP